MMSDLPQDKDLWLAAQLAVTAPKWEWMSGMLVCLIYPDDVTPSERRLFHCLDGKPNQYFPLGHTLFPDFRDPATVGCLYDIVARKAALPLTLLHTSQHVSLSIGSEVLVSGPLYATLLSALLHD